MAEKGIKETMEALTALMELGERVNIALADGKVNLMDIGVLLGYIPTVRDAVDGAHQIPLEIKDLDASEIDQIVQFLPVLFGAWAGLAKKS